MIIKFVITQYIFPLWFGCVLLELNCFPIKMFCRL